MKRRHFLQRMGGTAACGLVPMTLIPRASAATPERFLISLTANGGWDPTSLMDPKGNADRADGRGPVNRYQTAAIGEAGNLRYAGYAAGITPPDIESPGHLQTFFQKHYRRLLVINGIDTQTNGHDSGRRFVWSGRLEAGYPSVAALSAASYADLPMSFISNGGYDFTASLVPAVRTADPRTFSDLAYPNRIYPDRADKADYTYFSDNSYALLQQARQQRLGVLKEQQSLPLNQRLLAQLENARHGDVNLDTLLSVLPQNLSGGLMGQAEVAVAAFASGMSSGANLTIGGFDTHGNHDNSQSRALTQLLEGVDHLWSLIEANGMQDKVTIIIGSDFGRTPFYNNGNGKDHWNITSIMAMGAGISGNQVIGGTDANFEALKVSTSSLALHSDGITLTPRHIHRALRDKLGIDPELDARFPIREPSLPLFM